MKIDSQERFTLNLVLCFASNVSASIILLLLVTLIALIIEDFTRLSFLIGSSCIWFSIEPRWVKYELSRTTVWGAGALTKIGAWYGGGGGQQ